MKEKTILEKLKNEKGKSLEYLTNLKVPKLFLKNYVFLGISKFSKKISENRKK